MYRPPFADCNGMYHNYNYANGPIGLINNEYRRRPVRGRRTLRNHPTKQVQRTRPPHVTCPHGHVSSTRNKRDDVHVGTADKTLTRADIHVNTTNNNATSQNRPCNGPNGVTVINKVHVQDSKKQNILSTTSTNENKHCEKVILGPEHPTEVSSIQLNIKTHIQPEDQNGNATLPRVDEKSLEHKRDCLDRLAGQQQSTDNVPTNDNPPSNVRPNDVDDSKKPQDVRSWQQSERKKHQQTSATSSSSFNEIYESLERCRLGNPSTTSEYHHPVSNLADLQEVTEDDVEIDSIECKTTDSLPPLIERSPISENISSGLANGHQEDTNRKIENAESAGARHEREIIENRKNDGESDSTGVREIEQESSDEIIESCNNGGEPVSTYEPTECEIGETCKNVGVGNNSKVRVDYRTALRNGVGIAAQADQEGINAAFYETANPKQKQTDGTDQKSLQIFCNDPAAIVASVQGNVHRNDRATKRVLNKPLSTTTPQYPTNPAHLMEQLTIVKMHRDIIVETLEDKKTEVSRLWERLDVMKSASDRLVVSNNELCTEREVLKKQLEINIAEKEKAEKKIEILNKKLATNHSNVVNPKTVAIQTDQLKDESEVEKEALRLRVVQLQKTVTHKDNRIRVIADNANRTNQKLRNELDSLRNSQAAQQRTVMQWVVPPAGPGVVKSDICDRTDRRDKLVAELPHWNYINPCDLDPIITLGEKTPVVIGKGVFGKVELMQFLPTRTLVAVKTVYLEANAPEKTRNHIRQKFQCEVRAMQVTSTHFAFPFLLGVVNEEFPLRLVALFIGDHQTFESRTLSRILKDGPKQVMVTHHWVNVMLDVVLGVKFLHENNLLHNDLKGDNIIVFFRECRWTGKIIDLGQVSSLNHPQQYNLCEEEKARFRKNHTHIAPELVNGTHTESTASDIFQMGLIIREVGLKIRMKLLELLGESCINRDPMKRPKMADILAHKAFDGHTGFNGMRI